MFNFFKLPHFSKVSVSWAVYFISLHFLKDFIYLFLERGEGREKERERNIDRPSSNQHQTRNPGMFPNQNRTGDLSVCGKMPNQLSHTGHGYLIVFAFLSFFFF